MKRYDLTIIVSHCQPLDYVYKHVASDLQHYVLWITYLNA